MAKMERRKFLQSSLLAGLGLPLLSRSAALSDQPSLADLQSLKAGQPVIISSANGERAVKRAMEILLSGGDPLTAVISGVNIIEDDPEDITVGYGGLPNEDGVVQLDASVMFGPTHSAGAVAALEGIRNPSRVARLVMERSDHQLLVGAGALRFAKAHGFQEENLLTEKSRRIWLQWKESLSDRDNWLAEPDQRLSEEVQKYRRVHGTINCCALDGHGDLAGVTTTSGLAFKLSGRVGDSPVVGAGLYVDNRIGAAGSTGRGEANLANLSSFFIVERMGQGKTPVQACLEACQRIVDHNRLARLCDADGRPTFNVNFYALDKGGRSGGAGIYSGGYFWVHDGRGARKEELAYLFKQAK